MFPKFSEIAFTFYDAREVEKLSPTSHFLVLVHGVVGQDLFRLPFQSHYQNNALSSQRNAASANYCAFVQI